MRIVIEPRSTPVSPQSRHRSGARAGPRECDVGGGDIEGGYPIRRSAFGEGEGEAPGAAPDIEHAAMIRWARELRKRTGEQPRPPPEKSLIGGPVARAVHRRGCAGQRD